MDAGLEFVVLQQTAQQAHLGNVVRGARAPEKRFNAAPEVVVAEALVGLPQPIKGRPGVVPRPADQTRQDPLQ